MFVKLSEKKSVFPRSCGLDEVLTSGVIVCRIVVSASLIGAVFRAERLLSVYWQLIDAF